MRPAILQLLPSMGIGGVELACLDSIQAVDEAGFVPLVVSAGGVGVQKIEDCGGTHITLPVGRKNIMTAWKMVAALRWVIRKHDVRLVHAHSRMPAWVGYYAARAGNVPFITSFHGAYNSQNFIKHYYNSVMVRGEHIFAVSDFIRGHILQNYNIGEDRISVVYNGVDLSRFDKGRIDENSLFKLREKLKLPVGDNKKWIVMVGRATKLKGHELVLRAMEKLDENINVLFIVPDIGDGAVLSHVKKADDLGLGERVHFRTVGADDLPLTYGLGDICLLASLQAESFGRVIIEGQAMGGIVVASALGGALELVNDGESGFLFRGGDCDDLVRVLKNALNLSVEQKNYVSRNAIYSARKFSLDIYRNNIIENYRKIIT